MKVLGIYIILWLFIGVVGCTNVTKEKALAITRTPNKVVTNENSSIGVYSYDNFKAFLEADNDTTYVVNFWATWCKPCVAELPYFQELYQNYKDQKVKLILVSLDFEKQLETKLLPFIEKNQLKGEVIVLQQKGMNDWIDKIDPKWSGALPATIIYNGKKNKRQFYEQDFHYPELEAALKSIL